MQGEHRERQIEPLLVRGDRPSGHVPARHPHESSEDRRPSVGDHDFHEPGQIVELPCDRWDVHLDGRVVDAVGESVLSGDRPCPGGRVSRLVDQVARPSKRGGVCPVLLVPLLEDHLPGVEGQGRHRDDGEQRQREDHDDLAALAVHAGSSTFHVNC